MSDLAFVVPAGPSPSPSASPAEDLEVAVLEGGETIGAVHVLRCDERRVELRTPGELGLGRALVGLVPIVWCVAAWVLCLREHLLAERLRGCLALSLMATVSLTLMISSLGVVWRFDGRRRTMSRRVGLMGRTHNARRLAGLRVESTRTLTDVELRMILVDATGQEQYEIAAWNRREIDRGQVDALAGAIRRTMGWDQA
ncbi:MAG TPA: hypothetical protein VH475_01835 [Tepidisphaeraceae bacterium]|jgi:hypothetical protein